MVEFIWSNNNKNFNYDPNKNYLLYFRGCCCPPHKGHLQSIQEIVQNRTNFVIIIDQLGTQSRHGVPFRISREIWKEFIKYSLPQVKVILEKGQFFQKHWKHHFDNINTVLFVRGDEGKISHSKIEQHFNHKHQYKLRFFKKHNIEVFYYGGIRDPKLSATHFVTHLLRNRHVFDLDHIYDFLPNSLPQKLALRILSYLKRCSLII